MVGQQIRPKLGALRIAKRLCNLHLKTFQGRWGFTRGRAYPYFLRSTRFLFYTYLISTAMTISSCRARLRTARREMVKDRHGVTVHLNPPSRSPLMGTYTALHGNTRQRPLRRRRDRIVNCQGTRQYERRWDTRCPWRRTQYAKPPLTGGLSAVLVLLVWTISCDTMHPAKYLACSTDNIK